MKTHQIAALAFFVILGALTVSPFVPKLVAADTYIIPNTSSSCSGYGYSADSSCVSGVLHVYVQVIGGQYGTQYGSPYGVQYPIQKLPSDFTVTVVSPNSAPISFPGSQSGTNLSVVGNYTVTANALAGYTPTYSVGCNDSVGNHREATCIITESAGGPNYPGGPVPYPYPYVQPVLSCTPSNQTVGLGQPAVFSVSAGFTGPFTWSTPTRTYQAIGPVFTTTFANTGTQVVTVMSGTQVASCRVDVVAGVTPSNYVAPSYVNPSYVNPNTPVPPAYYNNSSPVSLTSSYVPSLPNTGYGPLSSAQVALLLGMLVAAGIFLAPYVRETLIAIG